MAVLALACCLIAPSASGAATLTVTSADDDVPPPPGSLREAIYTASGSPGQDIINFALPDPSTIKLVPNVLDGELDIASDLKIVGPGADKLEVNGSNKWRVFEIQSGVDVSISGVTISDGNVSGAAGSPGSSNPTKDGAAGGNGGTGADAVGGGLLNAGNLSLTGVTLESNIVSGGSGGPGGAGAYGGKSALAKDGGGGGAGGSGGTARGGAIANTGNLALTGVQIDGNSALGGRGGAGGDGGGGGTLIVDTVEPLDGGRGGGGGNGGFGIGAGIWNSGNLTTSTGAKVLQNTASSGGGGTGGAGGSSALGLGGDGGAAGGGGNAGQALGGALANDGHATVVGATLNANAAVAGSGGSGNIGGLGTDPGGNIDDGGTGGAGGSGGAGGFAAGGAFYLTSPALIVDVDIIQSESRAGNGGAGGSGNHGGLGGCGIDYIAICRPGGNGGAGGAGGAGGRADGGAIENFAPAAQKVIAGNLLVRGAIAEGGAGGAGGAGAIAGPGGGIVVNFNPEAAGISGPGGSGGFGGEAYGGGIRNQGTMQLSGSTIENAEAQPGGGGPGARGADGAHHPAHLSCPGSGANGGNGGAGGAGLGGGIANVHELLAFNSTIVGNSAGNAPGGSPGAGGIRGGDTGGCYGFPHNGASGSAGGAGSSFGGGVLQNTDPGVPAPHSSLIGLTVASNQTAALSGGGNLNVIGPTLMEVSNSIVAPATHGGSCAGAGVVSTGFNDDVGAGCPSAFNFATDIHGDPQLQPLGYYGGPTPTMAILRTSPVVNKGNSFDSLTLASTDQRGRPRPYVYPGIPLAAGGDGSDIGAFELQDEPATVSVSIPQAPIVANGTSQAKIDVTVKDADGNGQSGHSFTFTSTDPGNTFSGFTDAGGGQYSVMVTSSTSAGPARITATDTTLSPDVSGGACCLNQVAGPATSIKATIAPSTITADGRSHTTLAATVTDAHGNRVSGDDVGFTSDDPDQRILMTIGPQPNGLYTATLFATTRPGHSTITARDKSVTPNVISDGQTLNQIAPPSPLVPPLVTPPASGSPSNSGPGTQTAPATAKRKCKRKKKARAKKSKRACPKKRKKRR